MQIFIMNKKKFQKIVDEFFNPDFKVEDFRQDPGYGYDHIYILQLESEDYRLGLLVDTNKEGFEMCQDEFELEDEKTIWDLKSRG